MRMARIEGPQACPKGLRHDFGIAAVTAGVPLPTIAAVPGHANVATTAIYTTAAGVEAWGFLAKMRAQRGEIREHRRLRRVNQGETAATIMMRRVAPARNGGRA